MICCLLFVTFIVGFAGASIYGVSNGDPYNLLISWDEDGNGCGLGPKTLDYPFFYWPKAPSTELLADVKGGDFDAVITLF